MAALIRGARVEVRSDYQASGPVPSVPVSGGEVYLPLTGIVDLDQERSRCEKLLAQASRELGMVESRFNNPDFLARAPEDVRRKNETRRGELQGEITKLKTMILQL